MKKQIMLLMAMLISMSHAHADEIFADPVSVPQGGRAQLCIRLSNPDKVYTGGQMALSLPEGISAVVLESGDLDVTPGERFAGTNHGFGAVHKSNGTEQITLFSINSSAIPDTNGALFYLNIEADGDLAIGTTLEGRMIDIELTTVDAVQTLFNDQTFSISIAEPADTRLTLDENSVAVSDASDGVVDVRVKRTIAANTWSTICLPFDMTEAQVREAFGEDVELADFVEHEAEEDADGNIVGITVNFETATSIEANHPYIIKVSEPVTEFTVDGVTIDPQEDDACIENDNGRTGSRRIVYSGFYGTYHAGTVVPEFCLFLSDNRFWYSMGQTAMKAYRAYFEFYDVLTDVDTAYGIKMSFDIDGVTTPIDEIDGTQMADGKSSTGKWYDLSGRRLAKPMRGVNVTDGRKVVVK